MLTFRINYEIQGVVQNMGKEQFLGMYLAGGVISSFSSYLYKAFTSQAGLSLGAVSLCIHLNIFNFVQSSQCLIIFFSSQVPLWVF